MKKMICTTLFALAFASFAMNLQAQDKNGIPEGAKEAKLEKVNYVSAASIDFRGDLNLPFAGLTTLGSRMEVARQSCDPIGLAACALELKAAEAASGKTAKLTSKQMLDEAYDLAFNRCDEVELKAMKVLMPEKTKDLDKLVAITKSNEASRGFNELHVDNHSGRCVNVFINGRYKGETHAHECGHFDSGMCPHHCMNVEIRLECGHPVYKAHISQVVDTWNVTIH